MIRSLKLIIVQPVQECDARNDAMKNHSSAPLTTWFKKYFYKSLRLNFLNDNSKGTAAKADNTRAAIITPHWLPKKS